MKKAILLFTALAITVTAMAQKAPIDTGPYSGLSTAEGTGTFAPGKLSEPITVLAEFHPVNTWAIKATKVTTFTVWNAPDIELFKVTYIDSTFSVVDTSYKIEDNTPCRLISYAMKEAESGKWIKATNTLKWSKWQRFDDPVGVTIMPYYPENGEIVIIGDVGSNGLATWTREATPTIFKINDDQSLILEKPKKHKHHKRFAASTSKTTFKNQ